MISFISTRLDRRLLLVICVYLVFGLFELLASVHVAEKTQHVAAGTYDRHVPLYDVGFELVEERPQDSNYKYLPDYTQLFMLVATIVMLIVRSPDAKYVDLRRFILISTIMTVARTLSISLTALPDPFHGCATYTVDSDKHVIVSLAYKIIDYFRGTSMVDCHDVFFSGHAAFLVLCACAWTTHRHGWWEALFAWLWVLVSTYTMLIVRFHYTVDIVFGAVIGYFCWEWYYHQLEHQNYARFYYWAWLETNDDPASERLAVKVEDPLMDLESPPEVEYARRTSPPVGFPLVPKNFKYYMAETIALCTWVIVVSLYLFSCMMALALELYQVFQNPSER